ncbi:MAG: hypothetical protein GYA59_08640, partial [Chloroflexi bacterium]|nr:hypothetical protein [Chloroflexota bacterium]
HAPPGEGQPVVIFNASTRLSGLSLNAAFSLLTAWALRLTGTPVVHYVCDAGLGRCVLGTNRQQPQQPLPCPVCVAQSQRLFTQADVRRFQYQPDEAVASALEQCSLEELSRFEYQGLPLGELVLPSLRWVLRRHHLQDDEATRYLYNQYILSAWSLAQSFSALLEAEQPRVVLVFNGMFYPEATVRRLAQQRGLPVISHEVGLQPFSAFFTTGEATAYPIDIPPDFELSPVQNRCLDAYLEKRFQGNFSMAGIRFWPEMRSLGPEFWQQVAAFKQVVPVFTNVIFDTSQGHANVVFENMFAWLDLVLEVIRRYPQTFFVIRAHPDETRPGKESRESVADWVQQSGVDALPNVLFVGSDEYFSSYKLIQKSKFVMVYNSTIGLEASLLGAPVLCGGKARFTQLPTVFFPPSPEAYRQMAEAFLVADAIEIPAEFQRNARRFLYYQLFRTSLPFDDFLQEDGVWNGYVTLKPFSWKSLLPQNSPTLHTILNGILYQKAFWLDE